MPMTAIWSHLAGAVVLGAIVAAVAASPRRRAGALLIVALAIAGLLILLESDLAAVAWLAAGGLLAVISEAPRSAAGADDTARVERTRSGDRSLPVRLAAGLPAAVLGVVLVSVVWLVNWRPVPPPAPAAQTAAAGGRLLTVDAALLLGAGLVLAVILVAAGWALGRQATHREGS